METIINNYLSGSEAGMMEHDSTGLIRRLKRSTERRAGNEYVDHVHLGKETLGEMRQDGTIAEIVDEWKSVDLKLLERILIQTYLRNESILMIKLKQTRSWPVPDETEL